MKKDPSLENGTRKSISSIPSNVYITEGFFLCLCAYKCLIHLIIEILFVQLYYAELSLSHSATRSLAYYLLLENLKKIAF